MPRWWLRAVQEVKVSSPDYVNTDRERAIEDFRQRIRNYEEQYQTLDVDHDRDLSFIKVINQGDKFIVNGVRGQWGARGGIRGLEGTSPDGVKE